MPPPKKGAKADTKAPAAAPSKSPTEEAEIRLFRQKCSQLARQKTIEEASAAKFHEEKDRLHHLWVVSKKDLEDAKRTILSKERERKDAAESAATEIRLYQQRIQHLLSEHAADASDAIMEKHVIAIQSQQETDRAIEAALQNDKHDIKTVMLEKEATHEEHIK